MFRYIFAILLLNFSYRSLGFPAPTNAPISLVNLLTALATSCENGFLSDQIKNKISYCSDLKSPHGEKQLECLIFYDINKQLCNAVAASKLALTKDYSDKINEEQDVNVLCGNTKDWVFSNLTELPHYKSSVEKVFNHLLSCGKVCGVEDLMSDDANYFCKYFKWGTDMLKKQVTVPSTLESRVQQPSGTGDIQNKQVITASNDLSDVQIKNITTSNAPIVPSEQASVKTEEFARTEAIKPEASSENIQMPSSANSAPSEKSEIKSNVGEEPMHVDDNTLLANDQADKPAELNPEVKIESEDKPTNPDTTLNKPSSEDSLKVDKEIDQLNNELEHRESVLETPGQSKDKHPSEVDDYQDSDEGKEGLGDIQGDDDSDDPMLDDVNKISKLEDKKEEQRESEKIKTIVSGITGESVPGLYPSFGQDDENDDDEDHFFSFFLTAVIMVVLIYVLYHNKNKVGKVFFGLILEGRQTGRRRNSRGHAYRRLDTLEQAMNTNTAAPPSKIIY